MASLKCPIGAAADHKSGCPRRRRLLRSRVGQGPHLHLPASRALDVKVLNGALIDVLDSCLRQSPVICIGDRTTPLLELLDRIGDETIVGTQVLTAEQRTRLSFWNHIGTRIAVTWHGMLCGLGGPMVRLDLSASPSAMRCRWRLSPGSTSRGAHPRWCWRTGFGCVTSLMRCCGGDPDHRAH